MPTIDSIRWGWQFFDLNSMLIRSIRFDSVDSIASIDSIDSVDLKGSAQPADPTIQKYQNKIFNKSSKNHQISHFSQI
jgi:hypothetical protein